MIDEKLINESLLTNFQELDTNKDGFLNKTELANTVENVNQLIKSYDLDKNNLINLNEFKSFNEEYVNIGKYHD